MNGVGDRSRVSSTSVAIGVATAFIAVAAALSFLNEAVDSRDSWRLRGTIMPFVPPARLPAEGKHV